MCMVCASFLDFGSRSYNSCTLRQALHDSEVLIHFKQASIVIEELAKGRPIHISMSCVDVKLYVRSLIGQRIITWNVFTTTLVSLSMATVVSLQNLYPSP